MCPKNAFFQKKKIRDSCLLATLLQSGIDDNKWPLPLSSIASMRDSSSRIIISCLLSSVRCWLLTIAADTDYDQRSSQCSVCLQRESLTDSRIFRVAKTRIIGLREIWYCKKNDDIVVTIIIIPGYIIFIFFWKRKLRFSVFYYRPWLDPFTPSSQFLVLSMRNLGTR